MPTVSKSLVLAGTYHVPILYPLELSYSFCFIRSRNLAGSTAIATAVPAAAASAARAAMPAPVPPRMGRLSTTHTCQFCQHTGPTYVKEKFGTCAIIAIVVLVLCFWPLFFLPLIMPSCKDKEHICTNCQRVVSDVIKRNTCPFFSLNYAHVCVSFIKVGENEADCDTCCQTETR